MVLCAYLQKDIKSIYFACISFIVKKTFKRVELQSRSIPCNVCISSSEQRSTINSEVIHSSHQPHPWPCIRCLSDLQGQAGQEADGQGSEISPHAVVSSDWPRSCVAGRWQSVLSEQSVRGLLFGFCCTGAWQEQLGRCTGFPLFMWGPGISTSAHCCAGGSAPTATYCTIKSVEGHREGEGRGGWEGFLPRILKEGHDTVLWEVIMLYH